MVSSQGQPIQPIWVTVCVPKDAVPGQYSGFLNIASGAASAKVDVKLKVVDWVLPETRDFASHMGLFQSPDTVALKYKVPMWSEEHWRLMEKSFALMGQWGNKEVYITCIDKTHLGNEHSMVRYLKQEGGSYRPDFSIAERYLDLALKYFGKPPVIGLYVWEYASGYGWHAHPGPEDDPKWNIAQKEAAAFTVLDPKTGELSEGKVPFWGTPESVAFWRPLVEGMRDILRKRGLEKSLMLGVAGDARPSKTAEADFKTVAPGVKVPLDWQDQSERVFALAGEVAAKLGIGK